MQRTGVALAGTTSLAGCSGLPFMGDDGPTGDGGNDLNAWTVKGGPDTTEMTITVTGPPRTSKWMYDPWIAWVAPGTTVTWEFKVRNQSVTAYHPDNQRPLRIPKGADSFDSQTVQGSGVKREFTLQKEGVYDYFSIPHETKGVVGSVIVGEPDPTPENEPGLQPPASNIVGGAADQIRKLNDHAIAALKGETITTTE
ncbi:MAG: plastocyanin/azurin family copper-binding protein [Halobacteriaceae archaeon]